MAETQTNNIPNNEIWYTSTDGNVVSLVTNTGFGATYISNTYENGKGIISFDGDITKIGDSAFRSNGKLATITMPNSVKYIGAYTFQRCTSLTFVITSNAIADIGEHAFDGCSSLTSIKIPSSIKRIQSNALYNCRSLTSVTIEAKTPPIFLQYIFYDAYTTNLVIYVPYGSEEAYKAAENFTQYADKIIELPEPSYKNFLDLEGLKTFWNYLKSTFISGANTQYLKLSTGSTKSVDIDSSKLAKGTSSDAGTKLATDGYLLDKITENESEALTNDEILSLFNISGGGVTKLPQFSFLLTPDIDISDDYIIDPTRPTSYIDNGLTINGHGGISKWVNPTQLACKQYDLIRGAIINDNYQLPHLAADAFGKLIAAIPLNYNHFIQTASKDENGEYTMMIETNVDLIKSSNPRFVFLSNSYGAFGIKSLENSVGDDVYNALAKIAEEDETLDEAQKETLLDHIEKELIGFNPDYVNLEINPDKIQVSETSITLKIPFDNIFQYANYPNYYEDDLVKYDKEGEGTGNMILWITGDY